MPTIDINDAYILNETGAEVDKVTGLFTKDENTTDAEKAFAQLNIGGGGGGGASASRAKGDDQSGYSYDRGTGGAGGLGSAGGQGGDGLIVIYYNA